MLKESFDQGSVHRYVEAVKGALDRDELRAAVTSAAQQIPGDGSPADKVRGAMPSPGPGNRSSGSSNHIYMSRNPIISLVQSSVEESLRQEGVVHTQDVPPDLWHRIVHTVDELLHPGDFSPDDPDWIIKIAFAMLGHLARGNHPFNPHPAVRPISDTARLVVVGDWGTGLPRAQAVAKLMAASVTEAVDAGREAHVIHLGDIYYSGTPGEDQRHVLDHWPVTAQQAAAGVTSWSLNGNHDMYSGGYGYFQTLLADPRFSAQHSPDGKSTSYFRLTAPSWEFVGLDTSWDHHVLTQGASAVLEPPQGEFVQTVADASDRKLVLFSHHQLVSAYDEATDIRPELADKLAPVLDRDRITAWWWGHEHRSMGFKATRGVQFPRCLGHGGVPVLQERTPSDPLPQDAEWEDRNVLVQDGHRWGQFGYAVMDLDGPAMQVRYIDETGTEVRSEGIT